MHNRYKISLVIPVLNEAENMGQMLSCIPKVISEVIVVDNGSTDKTVDICENFGARIISEKHRGYGAALKTGILEARGDIIVCMDGDNSYPLSEIETFLICIVDNKYDFVSGERILRNYKNIPLTNRIGNTFISWLIRKLFKLKLKDSQSGMWAFRKEIFHKIMPSDSSMGFSQEIKLRACLAHDIKCGEIRIPYRKRLSGKSKFRKINDSLTVLLNLLKLIKKYCGILRHKNIIRINYR